MSNRTFKFAVVEYEAYNPPVDNCRATIQGGKHDITIERNSWLTLFCDLRLMYPGSKFDIPEEIDVITFDKNFKLKE